MDELRLYYEHGGVRIYHGDARELDVETFSDCAVMVTDPPYGIAYQSGSVRKAGNARGIAGDGDTSARDAMLAAWGTDRPALVFGSWKRPVPDGTKGVLVWDKGGALGMGDLEMPWRFDHEEVYVIGRGFTGRRDCGSVMRFPPEQSMGRLHPHQKPVRLLLALLAKCPTGPVFDPFCGCGSTLVAAKDCGREAIGVELDERYCEMTVKRLRQETMLVGGG
jgi:hypothetical protein